MTISDLNHEQQVALVALIEAVAICDGEVSEVEGKEIGKIVSALGEDQYRALLTEAETRFPTITALRDFLATIKNQDAREAIFGAALDEAMVEITFDGSDTSLLNWLAAVWGIEIKIDEGDQAG